MADHLLCFYCSDYCVYASNVQRYSGSLDGGGVCDFGFIILLPQVAGVNLRSRRYAERSSEAKHRKQLTSLSRKCLFFWLKNFEGSEKALQMNFFYSQFNLSPQSPVFFPDQHPQDFVFFSFFSFFLQDGRQGPELA